MKTFTLSLILCAMVFITAKSQVLIKSGSPAVANSASILELQDTTKGFLLPRLTNAQMLAIASPPEGLMIYNTDYKTTATYNGTKWTYIRTVIINFDIPEIIGWQSIQQNMNIPGVEVGDAILINPTQQMISHHVIGWANVMTNGVVSWMLKNGYLTTSNPPAQDYKVTIIRS